MKVKIVRVTEDTRTELNIIQRGKIEVLCQGGVCVVCCMWHIVLTLMKPNVPFAVMSEVKVVITLLGVVAIVLLVLLVLCHFMGMWTWTVAWILSTREEKVGLTRSMGHYNANGYLVRDLHTFCSGLTAGLRSFLKLQYIWSALWSPKCSRTHRFFHKPHFGKNYCNIILSQHRGPLSWPFSTRFLLYDVMGCSTEVSWFDFQQRQEAHTSSTATRGTRRFGRGANHSLPSSADTENECSYTSNAPYTFMAGAKTTFMLFIFLQ